jgi:hypothetical protein
LTAAAAASNEPPPPPLITGLKQRLLTALVKAVLTGQPSDVAPSMQTFAHSFDWLVKLAIWRVVLLDRRRLLLQLAPPLTGSALAVDPTPPPASTVYAVYDMTSQRVTLAARGQGRTARTALLQGPGPEALLLTGVDPPPWERLGAAALCACLAAGAGSGSSGSTKGGSSSNTGAGREPSSAAAAAAAAGEGGAAAIAGGGLHSGALPGLPSSSSSGSAASGASIAAAAKALQGALLPLLPHMQVRAGEREGLGEQEC